MDSLPTYQDLNVKLSSFQLLELQSVWEVQIYFRQYRTCNDKTLVQFLNSLRL
jgi:hypothetical protein